VPYVDNLQCYICGEEIKDVSDNHHPDKKNKPKWTVPTHHKCHMIHHGIYPKNYNKLRQLVEARNTYQLGRIKYQQRIKMLVKLGFKPSKLDEEILKNMKSREYQLTTEYRKIVRQLPIWKEWLVHIQGTGETTMGQLIAYIGDINKFDSIAKLWSYFGLGLYDGKVQAYKKEHKKNFDGKKRKLMYIIAKTFVTRKHLDCFYADLYDEYKSRYIKLHPDYTKQHLHRMALRKVAKIFLRHLYKKWKEIENTHHMSIEESDCHSDVEKTDKEVSSLLISIKGK